MYNVREYALPLILNDDFQFNENAFSNSLCSHEGPSHDKNV